MDFIKDEKIQKVSSRKLTNSEEDIHQFIDELKSVKASLIMTMSILVSKLNIKTREARELVLNSPSWIDQKDNFIKLNKGIINEWSKDADEVEIYDNKVKLTFDLNGKNTTEK